METDGGLKGGSHIPLYPHLLHACQEGGPVDVKESGGTGQATYDPVGFFEGVKNVLPFCAFQGDGVLPVGCG